MILPLLLPSILFFVTSSDCQYAAIPAYDAHATAGANLGVAAEAAAGGAAVVGQLVIVGISTVGVPYHCGC